MRIGVNTNLDPGSVEEALRRLIAGVDYDAHKYLECDEDEGLDHYPDLAQDFARYYQDALSASA